MLWRFLRRLNPEIAIGFLVATGFWAGILAWQAAYAPTEVEKQRCEEAAKQAGRKSEEYKSLWEKTTTDPVAFFTFVLAISTGGLWLATIALYRAGERQIGIAQRVALTAERALTVVERAFLAISDMNISTIGQYGTIVDFRINIDVANSGRTPARNYVSLVNLVVFEGDVPKNFRFPDRSHDALLGTGTTIGPQSRTYFQVDFFIQDAVDVYEGRKKALIYGWLEYDDIFSDSRRHRTEFCLWIQVYADPRQSIQIVYGTPPPVLTGLAYHRYNGHDDDCMYRPGQTPVAEEGELPPPTPPPIVQPPAGFQPPPPFPPMTAQFQHGAPTEDA